MQTDKIKIIMKRKKNSDLSSTFKIFKTVQKNHGLNLSNVQSSACLLLYHNYMYFFNRDPPI